MSLIISIIQKGNTLIDTDLLEQQIPAPYNSSFGYESCRESLWGSELIRELGCKLIYSLKSRDIIVFDREIEDLKNELLILVENIDNIKFHTDYDKEFIDYRLRNALEMIKVANKEVDKVGIAIW